jgi:hypothetical protein
MYYDYFLDCWENGTIDDTGLTKAVERGYITEEEKQEIMSR